MRFLFIQRWQAADYDGEAWIFFFAGIQSIKKPRSFMLRGQNFYRYVSN